MKEVSCLIAVLALLAMTVTGTIVGAKSHVDLSKAEAVRTVITDALQEGGSVEAALLAVKVVEYNTEVAEWKAVNDIWGLDWLISDRWNNIDQIKIDRAREVVATLQQPQWKPHPIPWGHE
jgi:hypothetical protein